MPSGTTANSADQDQTPHHAVSDQDLQCFLTGRTRPLKFKENMIKYQQYN